MPKFDDKTIADLFGSEDAENERPERLKAYFFRNKAYESLKADLPIRILVGHKGVGKSALLKVCHLEDRDDGILSLWVRPNDVFSSVNTNASSFLALIENWKIGLSTLIVKKSLEEGQLFGAAQNVQAITGGVKQILSVLAGHVMDPGQDASKDAVAIMRSFGQNQRIRIYLDDLDRGWQARPQDIQNISALLNAVRDMAGEDNRIQFRIGLRTDVYHLVRTSDESTDKIEANLIWLIWTNHEILVAMAKRIATFFGENVDEGLLVGQRQTDIAYRLNRVIEPRFQDRGKWENQATFRVLMTLTRKRPRDLIKLFIYSAKEAHKDGVEIIRTGHLKRIFEKYSNERIRDVANEFKTELHKIEDILLGMKQTRKERERGIGPIFDDGQLVKKLQAVIEGTRPVFTSGEQMTPANLARFLFKCDFITARFDTGGMIVRKHFEDNQILLSKQAQFGFKWEIHPAYRWALSPQEATALHNTIELSNTDAGSD